MEEMIIGRHGNRFVRLAKIPMDDGDLVVSANDRDICIWDPSGGTLVARSKESFNGIHDLAVCRRNVGGPVIAVATEDTIGWVDALTGAVIPYPAAELDTYWGLAVADMPDGSEVLFGGAHCAASPLLRWDVDSGLPLPPLRAEDFDEVTTLAVVGRANGPIVFAGGGDIVRQWDAGRGVECGPKIVVPDDGMILDLAAAELPDGRILLACSTESALHRWDAVTGDVLGPPIWDLGHVAEIRVEAGHPYLITAEEDGMVRRRDAETAEAVDDLMQGDSPVTFNVRGIPMIATGQPGGVIAARPLIPLRAA